MSTEETRNRAELLKRLREQHQASVSATQALLKELQAIRKEIRHAMQDKPLTVPELAAATGLPAHEALWHITAMKKYNLVTEVELDDGYYRYRLAEETKQ